MSTLKILKTHAALMPDKVFIKSFSQSFTYRDFILLKDSWIKCLSQYKTGKRFAIAVMASSTVQYLAFFLAAWELKVPLIPIDPSLKEDEILRLLHLTKPSLKLIQKALRTENLSNLGFITMEDFQENPQLGHDHESMIYSNDIATVYVTSGSTSEPKGVLISYEAIEARSSLIVTNDGINNSDRILCPIPLTNSYAMDLILPALRAGAFIFLFEPWLANPSSIFRMIEKERITIFSAVPFFYKLSLKIPLSFIFNLSTMRIFHTGSAPIPDDVLGEFKTRYGHDILQGYGLVESGFAFFNRNTSSLKFLSSIGQPLPGLSFDVSEEDELIIWGPTLFSGYLNNPEATEKHLRDGKLYTNDIVHYENNNLWFIGRMDSRINISGVKVHPEEIELAALRLPFVKHAAVTVQTDAITLERPILNVVLDKFPGTDDEKTQRRSQILDHLKNCLSDMKCPKDVKFFRDFPLSPLNKILKHQICEGD